MFVLAAQILNPWRDVVLVLVGGMIGWVPIVVAALWCEARTKRAFLQRARNMVTLVSGSLNVIEKVFSGTKASEQSIAGALLEKDTYPGRALSELKVLIRQVTEWESKSGGNLLTLRLDFLDVSLRSLLKAARRLRELEVVSSPFLERLESYRERWSHLRKRITELEDAISVVERESLFPVTQDIKKLWLACVGSALSPRRRRPR